MIKVLDFEKELKNYNNHKYISEMDIFMVDKFENYYSDIGKHIYNNYSDKLKPEDIYYVQKIKEYKGIDVEIYYSSIAINFLHSLNSKFLLLAFGSPLIHNNFGNGFSGKFDKITRIYSEPEDKSKFASYFIEIENTKIHIGYDHIGTKIEVNKNTTPQKMSNIIKILSDKYFSIN